MVELGSLFIDKQKWIEHSFVLPDCLIPKVSACYAFFSAERCLYVGGTRNLRARMALHQWKIGRINGRKAPPFETAITIRATEVPMENLKLCERLLILTLRPEMNIQFNPHRTPRPYYDDGF